MTLRKVLFIAYNFPPHGGAGVQRSLKFVKYLDSFGWQPVVITTQPSAAFVRDNSLIADIPKKMPIIRIPGFSIHELIAKSKPSPFSQLPVLLNLLLQIPDPGIFWARKAYNNVAALIEKYNPKVIYTTSGPCSSHILGSWLKHKYDIPWIADFRDPWSKNLVIPYLPGYRWLNKVMEHSVLDSADKVVSVSESLLEDLYKNLGRDREKFTLIHNGFDEDDITKFDPESRFPFTITHIGSLYRNRIPHLIVRAISNLINEGSLSEKNIHLRFIGKEAINWFTGHHWISQIGYVPHSELTEYRASTDLNLLILNCTPDNRGTYSGKLFEYLASNRPILGIVPKDGVAEQLIFESRTGISVSDDVAQIQDAIKKLYHDWELGYPDWSPNWEVINRFTRRNLTQLLAKEFEQLARNRGQA